MAEANNIEIAIADFFLRSSDFNGLPMTSIVRMLGDKASAQSEVSKLVQNGRISCTFSSISINPHIKRLRDLPTDEQLALLVTEPTEGICLYPSSEVVRERSDIRKFDDRPFTKELLLGRAQLDWEGFDLGVLDRYYNDPRYYFSFEDHGGRLSVHDDAFTDSGFAERDKVFLQTFGIGYDESHNRVAVVFLRYLSGLSPEHQQYWKTFVRSEKIKLHQEYYRASYLGEFPEHGSYFGAILTEMKLVNELTMGI